MTEEEREREKLDRLINQLSRPDFVCVCSERFCIHWQVHAVKVLRPLLDSQPARGVTVSAVIGYEAGYRDGVDACVEKVKEMRNEWFEQLRGMLSIEVVESTETHYVSAADNIVAELESLTLDRVKQEPQS